MTVIACQCSFRCDEVQPGSGGKWGTGNAQKLNCVATAKRDITHYNKSRLYLSDLKNGWDSVEARELQVRAFTGLTKLRTVPDDECGSALSYGECTDGVVKR